MGEQGAGTLPPHSSDVSHGLSPTTPPAAPCMCMWHVHVTHWSVCHWECVRGKLAAATQGVCMHARVGACELAPFVPTYEGTAQNTLGVPPSAPPPFPHHHSTGRCREPKPGRGRGIGRWGPALARGSKEQQGDGVMAPCLLPISSTPPSAGGGCVCLLRRM